MAKKQFKRRMPLVVLSLVSIVFFLIRCVDDNVKQDRVENAGFESYAGSETCRSCHQDIYESHIQTMHHQTSAIATPGNVMGSNDLKKTFYFTPELFIRVEEQDGRLFQTAYQQGIAKLSRPFDFIIGSGKRGQTLLYWHENYIFQLPLTYFSETNEWTNSPGYANKVQFNRPITSRCLECHTTYFQKESLPEEKVEKFSKAAVLLGVECEKCHGPAAKHVSFHTSDKSQTEGRFITNPARLTRNQNLDMCRLCHGGSLTKSEPSFSFLPGDKLSDYFTLDTSQKSVADIDVHGNQFGMLSASKCFTSSNMTCTTCHSTHKNESKQYNLFAARCMNCHATGDHKQCKLTTTKNAEFLQKNCIDCHMPELPSKDIMVLREGQQVPTSAHMRSHFISIYRDEIKDILLNVTENEHDSDKPVPNK